MSGSSSAHPAPLDQYFSAKDQRETLSLFSTTATVRDEGQTHTGTAEIQTWLDRVQSRYNPRYSVQSIAQDGDRVLVTVEVSGTFPGSPAVLKQAFWLEHDKIVRLETL